ncbi:hypothetical protein ACWEOW_19680 [Monashia sp. NPDC004114]
MGSAHRRGIVATLAAVYAVLLLFGQRLLGDRAGVTILVASFVVGFMVLLLIVAPWAARGRPGPSRRVPPGPRR